MTAPHMGSSGELGESASYPHFIDGKTGRYLAFLNADEKWKQGYKNTLQEIKTCKVFDLEPSN